MASNPRQHPEPSPDPWTTSRLRLRSSRADPMPQPPEIPDSTAADAVIPSTEAETAPAADGATPSRSVPRAVWLPFHPRGWCRRLLLLLGGLLLLVTFVLPFVFGFVAYCVRIAGLAIHGPIFVEVHEPLAHLKNMLDAAELFHKRENYTAVAKWESLHPLLCEDWRHQWENHPPSMDWACDHGEHLEGVKERGPELTARLWIARMSMHIGAVVQSWDVQDMVDAGRSWNSAVLEMFLTFEDLLRNVTVDLGAEVEERTSQEYAKWRSYKRKNHQAYDKSRRIEQAFDILKTGEAFEVAHNMSQSADDVEMFLNKGLRPANAWVQEMCHPPAKLSLRDQYRYWKSEFLARRVPEDLFDPLSNDYPLCRGRLTTIIDEAQELATTFRGHADAILDAIARIEALRCGLRGVRRLYTPDGYFPEWTKRCGHEHNVSILSTLSSWFFGDEQWPNTPWQGCHGSEDAEMCHLTEYGFSARLPPVPRDHEGLKNSPIYSTCLLAELKSCESISANPFWHLRNAALLKGSRKFGDELKVEVERYGCDAKSLWPVEPITPIARAMVDRKRGLNVQTKEIQLYHRPSQGELVRAFAAKSWRSMMDRYVIPAFWEWQGNVVGMRALGQLVGARLFPAPLPVDFGNATMAKEVSNLIEVEESNRGWSNHSELIRMMNEYYGHPEPEEEFEESTSNHSEFTRIINQSHGHNGPDKEFQESMSNHGGFVLIINEDDEDDEDEDDEDDEDFLLRYFASR